MRNDNVFNFKILVLIRLFFLGLFFLLFYSCYQYNEEKNQIEARIYNKCMIELKDPVMCSIKKAFGEE